MLVINTLADVIKANMPEETILVTPTLGEGRRLLQMIAETGQLIMGVRVMTPYTLAQEICASDLSAENAPRLIETGESRDLMFRTLKAIPEENFFAGEHTKDRKTAEMMLEIISELSANCVTKVAGNPRQDAIQILRDQYEAAKKAEMLLDQSDLLTLASQKAAMFFAKKKPYFITLSSYIFSRQEKVLLDAAASSELQIIPVSVPDAVSEPAECMQTGNAALSVNAAHLRFIRCRGTETEERFIMRDILDNDLRAEECAVVYMNSEYAAGLYTEAQLFHIPITISGGIPLTGSQVYMVLSMLSDWSVSDYDAEKLRTLLLNGAISIPNAAKFAKRLRDKNIGWGEKRYTGRFLEVTEDEHYPPEAEVISEWKLFIETILQTAKKKGTLEEQKSVLYRFLKSYAAVRSSEEAAALTAAEKILQSISWLDDHETVLDRLLELMEESSYLSGHEEPGKLFATSLSDAFCTGRKTLYICGMSRFCMQGSRQESPLLLDEEKKTYGLPTIVEREQENTFRLCLLLHQHEGNAVLSYCDYDTERMIELQPAPLYRELAGNQIIEKITYVPREMMMLGDLEGSGQPVNIEEAIATPPDDDTEAALLHPAENYTNQFLKMSFSPTSLEEALECPLKFYLKRIIGLVPAQIPERSNDAWLDNLEMGSLCHAVLERFYDGEGSLEHVFNEELELVKERRPETKESAVKSDSDRAWEMINRAVRWTTDSGHQVIGTEKPFGKKADAAPIQLTIGERKIGLSGSIDRVDHLPDGSVAILDYKTGTSQYYRDNESIKLQPYLYTRALEQLDSSIHVTDSGYLFLKDTTDYFAVPQTQSARELKQKVICSLLEWMQDEEKARTAAPEFVICQETGIDNTGKASDRKKHYKSCSGRCEYAGFCLAVEQINAAEQRESETAEMEENEDE